MRKLMVVLLSMVIPLTAFAQNQAEEGEVIVIEELTKAEIAEQIILLEEDLYRLFNANNSSDEFDFACRKETPTGTHFPERICEPAFLTKARQLNNFNQGLGLDDRLSPAALEAELTEEFAQLNAEYAKLIEDNQGFSEVVQILATLRARQEQL